MNHAPRCVLEEAATGARLQLDPEDALHLTRALRLGHGAPLEVLDGRGRAYEARLQLGSKQEGPKHAAFAEIGALTRHAPAPGEPGAPLPRIEVWAPLPKGPRAADCVARLAQLGVALWQPIITELTEAEARADGEGRREKLQRTARETLKQSGSLHALLVHPALPFSALPLDAPDPKAAAHATFAGLQVLLDPYSPSKLSHCLQTRPTAIRLWAGPEAGLTADECNVLDTLGYQRACIAPYVLRIETALEAAAAISIEHCR